MFRKIQFFFYYSVKNVNTIFAVQNEDAVNLSQFFNIMRF
jgi:hypothetical protein